MNTQLDQIDMLFLKDTVTNTDVATYLDHILSMKQDSNEQLISLRTKLFNNSDITNEEKKYLQEILKNVMQLFRTYGKKSDGLTRYINLLKICC